MESVACGESDLRYMAGRKRVTRVPLKAARGSKYRNMNL